MLTARGRAIFLRRHSVFFKPAKANTMPGNNNPVTYHEEPGARPNRAEVATAAVVAIFNNTFVSPLPEGTWLGVNAQVLNGGNPELEQDKLTSVGAPIAKRNCIQVIACGLTRLDGLCGRVVVQREIEAHN